MKSKVLKISTGSVVSVVEVEGPTLKELQTIVDGGMEIVRPHGLPYPLVMIVDDEGLLKRKRMNPAGCVFYGTVRHGHPIVGDIAVLAEVLTDDGYDLIGITDNQIAQVLSILNWKESATKEKTPIPAK